MAITQRITSKHGIVLTGRPANKSGDYLRETRCRLSLSRREAADLAGCTAQTIGRYERNGISGNVRYSRVMRLCEVYGISVDHLLSLMMQPVESKLGTQERRTEMRQHR